MSAPSYDSLTAWVDTFDSMLNLARAYDNVEVSLVFAQPWVPLLPGAALIRTLVARDAAATWSRALAARARLRSAHDWLAQSRDSVEALGQGAEAWQHAAGQARGTLGTMTRIHRQERDWRGAGAEGQAAAVERRMRAQNSLVRTTHALQTGCQAAQQVMSQVFSHVAVLLASHLIRGLGTALRTPSAGTGLFGLNSRMKAVASALEAAAAQYEAVRSGDGWAAAASGLASHFASQAEVLGAVGARTRGAVPV